MTSSSKEPRQKLNPDARVDSQTETKTSSNEWLSFPMLLPGSIFAASDLKTNLRRLLYPFDLAYFTFTQYDKSQKLYTHSKKNFNIEFINHHICHASSVFFVSPYQESAILTIDGRGESVSTMFAYGKNNQIDIIKEFKIPNSIW